MKISYLGIPIPANICCFSHNRNNTPKKEREIPIDLYI